MNARIPTAQLADDLLQKLQAIVGADGLKSDADTVEQVTRTCVPVRTLPSAVVYPRSVAEVQAVVRAAGASDVPIWPVRSGKNWGDGERSAAYDRGITMILERMNQIVHVDEQLGYAVIEPGVPYEQLNDHLKQSGSRLWVDYACTTQNSRVIFNALDQRRGQQAHVCRRSAEPDRTRTLRHAAASH